VGKICDFWPITRCISVITNRKSYTGFRLAPKSMTLNDHECQNMGFYGFFADFGLRHRSISHRKCVTTLLCESDRRSGFYSPNLESKSGATPPVLGSGSPSF